MSTLTSCTIFEPASPIASYIHIDSISVFSDYPTQGSNSKKIYDAWVIYDGQYLGTFPLPADVPLIGDGIHKITVGAGIIKNGISASRAEYPKYASFDTTLTLSTSKKVSFSPSVTYNSGIEFPQIEDFDDASLSLVMTAAGTAPLVVTQQSDTNSFEGNSGKTTLDATNTIFEVASSSPFTLPLNVPSYLELNYKGENDFSIGEYVTTSGGIIKSFFLNVRASPEWKKIYVAINDFDGVDAQGIDYKIFLHAEKSPLLSSANLYFDNLKVVY